MVHRPLGKEYINTILTKINMVFDSISLFSFVYKMCNIWLNVLYMFFATKHYKFTRKLYVRYAFTRLQ